MISSNTLVQSKTGIDCTASSRFSCYCGSPCVVGLPLVNTTRKSLDNLNWDACSYQQRRELNSFVVTLQSVCPPCKSILPVVMLWINTLCMSVLITVDWRKQSPSQLRPSSHPNQSMLQSPHPKNKHLLAYLLLGLGLGWGLGWGWGLIRISQ